MNCSRPVGETAQDTAKIATRVINALANIPTSPEQLRAHHFDMDAGGRQPVADNQAAAARNTARPGALRGDIVVAIKKFLY